MTTECVLGAVHACCQGYPLADPELIPAPVEVSVKYGWCPFLYDWLVQLPHARRHLILFPPELSVYIT